MVLYCKICRRAGHSSKNCYATTSASGKPLSKAKKAMQPAKKAYKAKSKKKFS